MQHNLKFLLKFDEESHFAFKKSKNSQKFRWKINEIFNLKTCLATVSIKLIVLCLH